MTALLVAVVKVYCELLAHPFYLGQVEQTSGYCGDSTRRKQQLLRQIAQGLMGSRFVIRDPTRQTAVLPTDLAFAREGRGLRYPL